VRSLRRRCNEMVTVIERQCVSLRDERAEVVRCHARKAALAPRESTNRAGLSLVDSAVDHFHGGRHPREMGEREVDAGAPASPLITAIQST
jgi:hypothetical protein